MTRDGCTARRARLVERDFVGDLSRWRRRRLRRHLGGCDDCRRLYDRLAAADRQLGAGRVLPETAIDAIGEAVVGSATPWIRRRSVWVGVGSLATAAAVLVALSVRDHARPELRPRGDGILLGDRTPGIRLFCVEADAAGARVAGEARVVSVAGPLPRLRCTLDDELQLAYSSPDLEGLTMVAFGRNGQSIHYYAPRSGEDESVPLVPDRIDMALDWSTRLGVNHQPGEHEVHVLFFDRTVIASDAAAGIETPSATLRARLEIVAPGAGR